MIVLGVTSIPPVELNSNGPGWPELGGAACNTRSSDTWTGRDTMRDAVKSFCSSMSPQPVLHVEVFGS
jgi:hypothetical protein